MQLLVVHRAILVFLVPKVKGFKLVVYDVKKGKLVGRVSVPEKDKCHSSDLRSMRLQLLSKAFYTCQCSSFIIYDYHITTNGKEVVYHLTNGTKVFVPECISLGKPLFLCNNDFLYLDNERRKYHNVYLYDSAFGYNRSFHTLSIPWQKESIVWRYNLGICLFQAKEIISSAFEMDCPQRDPHSGNYLFGKRIRSLRVDLPLVHVGGNSFTLHMTGELYQAAFSHPRSKKQAGYIKQLTHLYVYNRLELSH
jgi:hypothetical protein